MNDVANTFSIVGRSDNGHLGVAVSSRVLAVGASCPFVTPGSVAISSQAYLNPYLALDLRARIAAGDALDDSAAAVLEADEGREWRQLIAIDASGQPFGFTGRETDPWSGHVLGKDCAAAGNLLISSETVEAMVAAFDASAEELLPERLLQAVEAGQHAGGDRRGKQSAALLVYATEEMPFVNLRVDDHTDPIPELRRLWSFLSAEDLERALRAATIREPRPLEEIQARQAALRRTLADQGR